MPELTTSDRFQRALDTIEAALRDVRDLADDLPTGLTASLVAQASRAANETSVLYALIKDQRDYQHGR